MCICIHALHPHINNICVCVHKCIIYYVYIKETHVKYVYTNIIIFIVQN